MLLPVLIGLVLSVCIGVYNFTCLSKSHTFYQHPFHAFISIFQINGQVLYGRCHLNASAMIKGITASKVKMIVIR